MQKIIPHLWYAKDAEAAARFYVGIFPNSHIDRVSQIPVETPSGPPGTVTTVELTLLGQAFMAISAGPLDEFNHAVSFVVNCESQEELDTYWDALLEGGTPEACGWLRDRYGLSWQIVPSMLQELMTGGDAEQQKRVAEAVLKMVKLDIAELQRAYNGA